MRQEMSSNERRSTPRATPLCKTLLRRLAIRSRFHRATILRLSSSGHGRMPPQSKLFGGSMAKRLADVHTLDVVKKATPGPEATPQAR